MQAQHGGNIWRTKSPDFPQVFASLSRFVPLPIVIKEQRNPNDHVVFLL